MERQNNNRFSSLLTLVLAIAALAFGSAAAPAAAGDRADWARLIESNRYEASKPVLSAERQLRRSATAAAAVGRAKNFRLSNTKVRGVRRFNVDHNTRLTGWQLRDDLYFGRSKGKRDMYGKRELKGVALIWQPSQTQQVALSGRGLKLTRRLR